MADTITPKLGLVKPEINGAQTENVWGFDLNANFDKIDASYGAFVNEAPQDGYLYGRSNATWVLAGFPMPFRVRSWFPSSLPLAYCPMFCSENITLSQQESFVANLRQS